MMSTKCNAHSNTTLTDHIGYLVQDVNVFNINKYFCIEFFDICPMAAVNVSKSPVNSRIDCTAINSNAVTSMADNHTNHDSEQTSVNELLTNLANVLEK